MGSYYYFYDKECPYCGKIVDEIIFAENTYDEDGQPQNYDTARCEHCKNLIKIEMEFKFSKLEEC